MDDYTKTFFFEEIERILNRRDTKEIRPIFLFRGEDGISTALFASGNKAIGNIEELIEVWLQGGNDGTGSIGG